MFTIGIDILDKAAVAKATKTFSDRVRKFGSYAKVAKRSRASLREGLWNALEGFSITPDSSIARDYVVTYIFEDCLRAFFAATDGEKGEWLVMLLNVSSQTMLKNALENFVMNKETDLVYGEEN